MHIHTHTHTHTHRYTQTHRHTHTTLALPLAHSLWNWSLSLFLIIHILLCLSPFMYSLNLSFLCSENIILIEGLIYELPQNIMIIKSGYHIQRTCYQAELGSTCPLCSKVSLLTPASGAGKYSIYLRVPSEEYGQLMLKRTELPCSFQGRIFKGNFWGESCRMHDFLLISWWWGNRVVSQESSSPTSGSN